MTSWLFLKQIDEDNQGALHEPLHEPGKSCGEIRSCRLECPVHQVHQGIVSECPDHHRPLPHHTASLNSVEYDFSNSPVEGINRRIKSLKRSCFLLIMCFIHGAGAEYFIQISFVHENGTVIFMTKKRD